LRGGDFAATDYLKGKTTAQLTEAFRPVIETSLQKVNATKYWKTLFTTYNTFSTEKVNTDLSAYVTEKALSGIFYQVGLEEQKIRKDLKGALGRLQQSSSYDSNASDFRSQRRCCRKNLYTFSGVKPPYR
jgi:hypothetical protein